MCLYYVPVWVYRIDQKAVWAGRGPQIPWKWYQAVVSLYVGLSPLEALNHWAIYTPLHPNFIWVVRIQTQILSFTHWSVFLGPRTEFWVQLLRAGTVTETLQRSAETRQTGWWNLASPLLVPSHIWFQCMFEDFSLYATAIIGEVGTCFW